MFWSIGQGLSACFDKGDMDMKLFAAATAAFIALTGLAADAQNSKTILVLDASGSMWGQIESKHKIEIAREVIDQVLDDIPADRDIGLVAYGHNRKGDCNDIEELAAVGAERDAIRSAVNSLNPRGKTPLSDAVVFAANQLRYTEEAATVVLVSDGIETCEADPCEVGRMLEETGVDFTAHVVGFDVSEQDALKQLQCLAENTGGRFMSASNAGELTDALQETVAAVPEPAPEPEPKPATLTMRATENKGGPEITDGLTWKVQQAGGGEVVFETTDAGEITAEIPGGVYDIFVTRPAMEQSGEARLFEVPAGNDRTVTVAIEMAFAASVRTAPEAETPVGSDFVVYWEGPDREGDFITIVPKDADKAKYTDYAYMSAGNPLKLTAPTDPGEYEVRYVLASPKAVLATVPMTLTEVTASLEAAEQVSAGSEFDVKWEGPGYQGDWVTIVTPQEREGGYKSYFYPANDGTTLRAPIEAGMYELRYVLHGKRVIARRPIEVVDVTATLDGPAEVTAGSKFKVAWTGSAEQGDWVTIVQPDAEPRKYAAYFYPRKNAANEPEPGELKAPLEPGNYELRYVQAGKNVLASAAITVTEVSASLEFEPEVSAGAEVAVTWTGPDNEGDFVTYRRAGEDKRLSGAKYFYSSQGSPGRLLAPLEPGEYEMIYLQRGKKVLTAVAFTVVDVTATLDAPDTASEGSAIDVAWTGPGVKGDWITVVAPDAKDSKSGSYFYAQPDKPTGTLEMPLNPGSYEIRYVQGGKKVIMRRPIEVTAATATLEAPASGMAGSTIEVAWQGPKAPRDFVTIVNSDAKESKSLSYFYARDDQTPELTLPLDPGTYELRYILGGKKALTRVPFEVTAATATLSAPDEAIAEAPITVDWTGPAQQRDLITVAPVGEKPNKYVSYKYAHKGAPSELVAPKEPGTYEIRYVHGGKKIIETRQITVVAGE